METPIVYDKAKYHFESIEENQLPEIQAYVHTGLYLGWLVDNNLLDSEFINDFGQDIPKFKNKEITGSQLLFLWDGALIDDMLNEEGNKFSQYYFDFDHGQYITDYETHMTQNLQSIFHVEDTWENHETVKDFVNKRYSTWKNTESKSWWKIW